MAGNSPTPDGGGSARDGGGFPPLIVIAGATATGKTGLSIRLAEILAGQGIQTEIVSADSRQVYRGLDIGTAKVTPAERDRVPHHGLDLVDPDEPFTVADFAVHAAEALAGIDRRGAVALLVGGTGLYLRAVSRGLDAARLPWDPKVRAMLDADLERAGLAALADRLVATAPGLAATVDLRNPRRVIRALEIALLAGDVPRPPLRGYPGSAVWLGLTVDAEEHRRWIAERARAQFDAGLLDEAAGLLAAGYARNLASFSAIGYHEAFGVLDGAWTREEAILLDARRNVHFARRQRTWFRSEHDVCWIDATADALPAALEVVRPFVDRARSARS